MAVLAAGEGGGALRTDEPVTEPGAAFVVTTSGSTGVPKGVVLSASAVLAAVEATRDRLGIDTDWVCALPVHHVSGLMTAVRAVVLGTRLVQVDASLRDLPMPTRPTAISLVPTQLVRALREPAIVRRLAAHTAVLVGGAASAGHLISRARAAGIPVVVTYGMSETCGGCVYDGVPLRGVEIVVDAADGRVTIAGPVVFSGYRLNPELTASTLVDGRLRTQDRACWTSQSRLEVLGRMDDVVISGGENVDLAHVQRAVDDVHEPASVVVGVPDDEWGTVVTLVTTGCQPLAWWRHALAPDLPRSFLPRRLVRVGTLPHTASGKVDRRRLMRVLTDQPQVVLA